MIININGYEIDILRVSVIGPTYNKNLYDFIIDGTWATMEESQVPRQELVEALHMSRSEEDPHLEALLDYDMSRINSKS